MVEEILKRKRETIEKLKARRSLKEAILESKKQERDLFNRRGKKKRLKRRRRRDRNRICGSSEPDGKSRCMCNISFNLFQ